MYNKRMRLWDLSGKEAQTISRFCKDSIFNENVVAKIAAQGDEVGLLADIMMNDGLFDYWYVKLQQIKNDNPVLFLLMFNEGDYWGKRFQSLNDDMKESI